MNNDLLMQKKAKESRVYSFLDQFLFSLACFMNGDWFILRLIHGLYV